MDLTLSRSPKGNGAKAFRGKIPAKKTINLALVEEKKLNIPKAIFGILLILLLAGVFGKFLVWDRLNAMHQASGEAFQKKADLERLMAALDNYEGIEDTYAHYTLTGMTQEELGLVDRARILRMVEKVFQPEEGKILNWTVSGNVMTIDVSGKSLKYLNRISRKIEKYQIVDSCTITTANKNEIKDKKKDVKGRFLVYLQQPPEKEEAEKTEGSEETAQQ